VSYNSVSSLPPRQNGGWARLQPFKRGSLACPLAEVREGFLYVETESSNLTSLMNDNNYENNCFESK
jgi:hypothetical protein